MCPMPGYNFDVLAENGFIDFLSSILGVLAPANKDGKETKSYGIDVNFNGSKNLDPAKISSEIQDIKNIDQIMYLLEVSYIIDGKYETETFSGLGLRERSSLVMTQEGFCFNLFNVTNEKEIPVNMKFYFLKSDSLHGIKMQVEHTRGRKRKFKFYPFSTKGRVQSRKRM